MAGTDSVSVFAEGTFEEQIQELVTYIARSRPEEERAEFIRPFQDAFKTGEGQSPIQQDKERKRAVFDSVLAEVKGFGEGSEKETEGFFNLLYSHFLTFYPPEAPEAKERLTSLLQTIKLASPEHQSIKYRILSNLFNAISRTSGLRVAVYNTLLEIAAARDEISVLQLDRHDVEKWLTEWRISPAEKSAFLKSIVDAYTKTGQPASAYEYSLLYVRSLPADGPDTPKAAIELVAAALRLPEVFDFDPLFKIDAVIAAKEHELFSLLRIFLNDGLVEFNAWVDSHSDIVEEYALDRAELERKIRLLTFASLGFKYVGQDLTYSKVAEALQVEPTTVEKWAIDVIRAGLLWGKLSQTTQSLHIIRATPRTFEREQWEVLEKRLVAWQSGLQGVLDVIASARRQAGHGQASTSAAAAIAA